MIIIPARLNSTRFKNKILAPIFGIPMVVATAKRVLNIDETVVAADSQEVIDILKLHNIKGILTSQAHQSGTDRINEAATKLGLKNDDIIINVQADEPFIEEKIIKDLLNFTHNNVPSRAFMTSCYKLVTSQDANDPKLVKTVMDNDNFALYFSRSKIPYDRNDENVCEFYNGHLGLYGFTKESLSEFCEFSQSSLENIEKLEQLRALQNGKKIAMLEVFSKSFGIDSKEDLDKALMLHILN